MSSTGRFADLAAWIVGHLEQKLSVQVLAERVNLSPRQFSRRFLVELRISPAAFVQRLRLEEARRRLAGPEHSVEHIANSVGFRNPDTFRRAFVQRYGVAPNQYRRRFSDGTQPDC